MAEPQENPADLANRARRQGKNAAKNMGRAGRLKAEPVVEEAKEVVDKLENTAEDAIKTAKRFNPRMMGVLSGDLGLAFLGLGVAIYTGTVSVNKFRAVYAKSGRVMSTVVKEGQNHVPGAPGA